MSDARIGYGTLLQRLVGSSWETVVEIKNIGGPDTDSEDVEVTNHDSPSRYKEYIPGMQDGGTVNISGNFIPGSNSQLRLISDKAAGTVSNYRIVLPTAEDIDDRVMWSFTAYIKSLSFTAPVNTEMTVSASLKISGEPVLSVVYADDLTALVVTGAVTSPLVPIPSVAGSVYIYAYIGVNGDSTCTVTPTCATADAIYVNDIEVASGEASDSISLAVGYNEIVVKVVEAGKNMRIYSLNIVRPAA